MYCHPSGVTEEQRVWRLPNAGILFQGLLTPWACTVFLPLCYIPNFKANIEGEAKGHVMDKTGSYKESDRQPVKLL